MLEPLLNVQIATVRKCDEFGGRGKRANTKAMFIDMQARTAYADPEAWTPAELRDVALAVSKMADELEAGEAPT